MRAKAEVLDGLTGVLGTPEEEGVGASGGTDGKLVEGQALAASLDDPSTGSGSEPESGDGDLGGLKKTVVISDGTDNDEGLGLVALVLGRQTRERHRGAVDARHEEPAEDGLVESRVGTTSKEAVKLHEELDVRVLALGSGTVLVAHMVRLEIDT